MLEVAHRFWLQGKPESIKPYGEGHINQTFLMITDVGVWYILQKINARVFLDIPALMQNIGRVTRHLARENSDPRRVLTLVPTTDGQDYCVDPAGESWRVYVFVRDSLCLQAPEDTTDFIRSGQAFGRFQRQLADFPAGSLHETIRNFHNTPERFRQLEAAARYDTKGRLARVKEEMDFALARVERAGRLQRLVKEGRLVTRVTHNDTKLNNVLLDALTREPLCVIDLDTVMPGLAAHDFGDSIRFGASTAAEDETDLDRVSLSIPMFEAYAQGFLAECGDSLTQDELRSLSEGAWAMTLECGMRFLTDYLSGDSYYRVHREHHNLDRCRTQFKLVREMEEKWDRMEGIIEKLSPL